MGSRSSSESNGDVLRRGCNWVEDKERMACFHCERPFSFFSLRRHHCRVCGEVFCNDASGCWGQRLPLPVHLFVESDPLAVVSQTSRRFTADTSTAFLMQPQPVCNVCSTILSTPVRRIALSIPESLLNQRVAALSTVLSDDSYRLDDDEHITSVRIISVGKKGSSGALADAKTFLVNKRFRIRLENWRPFNKATRVTFSAVDPPLGGAAAAPGGVRESGALGQPDDSTTTRDEQGTPRDDPQSPPGSQASSIRRQRRKSRTDLNLDLNPTEDENKVITLPRLWGLSTTSVLHCDLIQDTTTSGSLDGSTAITCVKLETFSEVISIAADDTVSANFTLRAEDLHAAIKTVVGFGRVRGKVRMSTAKAPTTKILKRSKA